MAGRADFDDRAFGELDRLGRVVLNQLRERWGGEKAPYVAQDSPGLFSIGGDHHDRRALAGAEVRTIVAEAGEENGHQRHDERLAAAPTANDPSLGESGPRSLSAPRAGAKRLGLG